MTTANTVEIFAADTKLCAGTTAMSADRARHAATLLLDGRVVVAGGVTGSNGVYKAIDDVEVFDPTDESWSDLPPLPTARDLLTITALADGRVLAVGGRDGGNTRGDAWLLDAELLSWTEVTPGLTQARFGHTATLLPDGDVLIAGGRVGADSITVAVAERFDLQSSALLSAGTAPESRGGHTATSLDDGRVTVAGGLSRSVADETLALADTNIYDPVANDWDLGPDLNQPRSFSASANIPGEGVLLLGGELNSPLATVEIYLPSLDQWQLLPSLLTPRLAPTSATIDGDSALVIGGDGNAVTEAPLASAEIYGFAR